LLGREFKVSRPRGEIVESALAPIVTATVHPTTKARRDEMKRFVADLKKVAAMSPRARE
jgi:DNA polymerase